MKRFDIEHDRRCDAYLRSSIIEHPGGDYILLTDHEEEVNVIKSKALKNYAGWNRTVTDLREEVIRLKKEVKQAVAAEREACAKIAETGEIKNGNRYIRGNARTAAAIRQRGEK